MSLPQRRRLPHTPPAYTTAGATYFLTICCAERGRNQLALDPVWSILRESCGHYHTTRRWDLRIVLAMPDHVHLLASFPSSESMKRVVAAWKHYVARKAGVEWQRDFFDHRLRSTESRREKHAYILGNPVRAGLCDAFEAWRFWWCPAGVVATPE